MMFLITLLLHAVIVVAEIMVSVRLANWER